MGKKTLELLIKFKEKTGIMPLSAMLWKGSMKGYIRFTIPYSNEVFNFCSNENFYQKEKNIFRGVKISYLGNTYGASWHQLHGYEFEVKITDL